MQHLLKYKQFLATCTLVVFVLSVVFTIFSAAPTTAYAMSQGSQIGNVSEISTDLDAKTEPDFGTGLLGFGAFISYYILKFSFWLAGWAGYLFNIAFTKLVVGMGHLLNSLDGVTRAWMTLRDVGNIFLVFLLVYVGIATILGISGYGYKKLLWRILLAALLINFSITFTKMVIDVSNLLAIGMYEQFFTEAYNDPTTAHTCVSYNNSGAALNNTAVNDCIDKGLVAAFWSQLNITTIFNVDKAIQNANSKQEDAQWVMIKVALFGTLFSLVMAFVFGAAAFLLVGRFVILVFLIVISPVALVAWITKVSSSGDKWWHTLLNQSFFAPLILLMWYAAFKVLESLKTLAPAVTNDANLANVQTVDSQSITVFVIFALGAGFLIAGLILAKKFGAYGANAALNTGKNWSRKVGFAAGAAVGGATVGLVGYAGRQTVGRGAAKIYNSENLKEGATSTNTARRWASRAALAASNKVADSNFDARTLGGKSKALGTAHKGGFNQWAKDAQKREEDVHKHATTYTGTSAEKRENAKEIGKVSKQEKKDNKEFKREEKKFKKRERDAQIAAMYAQTPEELEAAQKALKKAQRDQEVNADLKKQYALDRRKEREDINKKYNDEYQKISKERAAQNLDRLENEKTMFVLPTPQWKKDTAESIRKQKNKKPEDKIKDLINEAAEEKNKESSENNQKTESENSSDSKTTSTTE